MLEIGRVFVVQPAGGNKMLFLLAKRGLADAAQEAHLRSLLVR